MGFNQDGLIIFACGLGVVLVATAVCMLIDAIYAQIEGEILSGENADRKCHANNVGTVFEGLDIDMSRAVLENVTCEKTGFSLIVSRGKKGKISGSRLED